MERKGAAYRITASRPGGGEKPSMSENEKYRNAWDEAVAQDEDTERRREALRPK